MPLSGGKITQFDPSVMQRLSGQGQQTNTRAMSSAFVGWMNPGQPIDPSAPAADVKGRQLDYNVAQNLQLRPKWGEGVPYDQLRRFARFDLVRIVLETVKARMANLKWSIQPKLKPGEVVRAKATPEIIELEKFLLKPDGEHSWSIWIQALLEDKFVLDAPTLYLRPNLSGGIYAIEYMDGAKIKKLIDKRGRTPLPPDPAYQSILKGMVAAEYTTDELIWRPSNVQTDRIYGYSKIEQIITTINIAIGRQSSQLNYYVEGNVPEALISVPEDWTVEQIQEFQEYWDSILTGDLATRRHAKFVPGGTNFLPTRTEAGLMDQFDEWLARILCYAFALPPLPFVKQSNRSVAETDMQRSQDDGDAPQMQWIKELMDDLIARLLPQFGIKSSDMQYELIWDDSAELDPETQSAIDIQEIKSGIKSIDEVRTKRGEDPLGVPHIVFGLGPNGFVFVKDIVDMFKQGINSLVPLNQPPMIDPTTGQPVAPPAQLGSPQGATDPLQGINPDLLAAVGLIPQQSQDDYPLSPSEMKLLQDVGLIPGGEKVNPKGSPKHFVKEIGKGAEVPSPPQHKARQAAKKAAKTPIHPKAKEAVAHAQSTLGGNDGG